MALLKGKKGLIMGVANERSIAWGIAKKLSEHGAELAFTYQSERLKGNVEKIATELGTDLLFECDVASIGISGSGRLSHRRRLKKCHCLV